MQIRYWTALDLQLLYLRYSKTLFNWVFSRTDEVREAKDMIETYSKMGRMGEPVEMAKIMAFMVSDYNAYLSGSEIISDGGLGAVA